MQFDPRMTGAEMIIVDTHVHTALHIYEPIEIVLAQMEHNSVAKTVLVQSTTTTDNTYIVECMRRFPGRFSLVCRVDIESPNALQDLEHWSKEGAGAVRFRNFHRSPGDDSLAIWRKAEELGMSTSVGGPTDVFASDEFRELVESMPTLKIVIEHLGGAGVWAVGSGQQGSNSPGDDFQKVLNLARYPNTYMKIHGLGEICPPPFPYQDIPPFMKMAYDAFGARRMMWGSDFPPVSLREGFRNALRFTMEQMPYCSQEDKEWIFGKTALSVYRFP